MKKTIRLMVPDTISGGLKEYWFGARLLTQIVPPNPDQPLVKVEAPVLSPDLPVKNGVTGLCEVLNTIHKTQEAIENEKPERIITLGGSCIVSLAPFDYLHGLYPNAGIIWIDAHPDVSVPEDGYPFAHAMVLGALLGKGDEDLMDCMENRPFEPSSILYLGLQELHNYQKQFLNDAGVNFTTQDHSFISDQQIEEFIEAHPQLLIHLDIDVLDPKFFHSTFFDNPELTGDGSGAGRMSVEQLGHYLKLISNHGEIEGFTLAEYLPFDEYRLYQALENVSIFEN